MSSADPSPPTYLEWPAPPELSRWVRCVWGLWMRTGDEVPAPQPIIPDGCSEIVLNLADPFRRRLDSGKTALQPLLMYVGQITGPMEVGPSGLCRVVGIRLQPWGGYEITGTSAIEMCNQEIAWTELDALNAAGRPVLSRATLETLSERLRRLSFGAWGAEVYRSLREYLPGLERRGRGSRLAAEVVYEIERTAGRSSVRSVARQLHLSERSVQRVMRQSVGLSPVVLGRILRFQGALEQLLRDPTAPIGRVAVSAGYHDQPHFNREFRRLTGTTPTAFLGADRSLTDHFVGVESLPR